jgi:MFS family permease
VRTALLIAANFAREQRWPILVLLLWVLVMSGLGLAMDVRRDREDLLAMFKQLAMYGLAFAVFFGGSAIHNERKSRRILAVISKGVGRREYVFGLLIGIVFALLLYCICMGLTGTWVLGPGGFSISLLWFLMLCFLVACVLAAAVAVLFSTFMPPLFATLASAFVLGFPIAAGIVLGSAWGYLIPIYPLLHLFLKANFGMRWRPDWIPLTLAFSETVLFWLLASWIFAQRDVAVALE